MNGNGYRLEPHSIKLRVTLFVYYTCTQACFLAGFRHYLLVLRRFALTVGSVLYLPRTPSYICCMPLILFAGSKAPEWIHATVSLHVLDDLIRQASSISYPYSRSELSKSKSVTWSLYSFCKVLIAILVSLCRDLMRSMLCHPLGCMLLIMLSKGL